MSPKYANTSPFRGKDMQKSAVFRSLGSSPPVHKARGNELKGDPQMEYSQPWAPSGESCNLRGKAEEEQLVESRVHERARYRGEGTRSHGDEQRHHDLYH